jgi:hypothetical protein
VKEWPTYEQFEQRMSMPAAKAVVSRVQARHRRLDVAKRRGAISDAAEARSSKFGQVVTPEAAQSYQARHMRDHKLPLADLIVVLRRAGDEMDAGLHATDHAGLRGNGDRSAYQQGDATEREAARPDYDAMMGRSAGRQLDERQARWRGAPRTQWQCSGI